MLNYLRGILQDLEKRTRFSLALPYEFELIKSLSHLEGFEKVRSLGSLQIIKYLIFYVISLQTKTNFHISLIRQELIKKKFRSLDWNVGHPRALQILTKSKITSITEYIQETVDPDVIESILNELLETEFQLISELIINSHSYPKLESYLKTCFEKFIKDAIETPNVFRKNFLPKVENHLNASQMNDFLGKFMLSVLQYKDHKNPENNQICNAIKNQKKWNQTFLEPKFNMIRECLQVIGKHGSSVVNKLMEESGKPNFDSWFYYLQILKYLIDHLNAESIAFMKGNAQ